jgi:hypothetical protein
MCLYLHAQQCPWDSFTAREAALCSHVELLQQLMDNGCPWEARQLWLAAAEGGSVEVLTHLQQQGLLTSVPLLTSMLNVAAVHNKLAAAQWLRQQGAEWPAAMRAHSAEVLAWATAEGYQLPAH